MSETEVEGHAVISVDTALADGPQIVAWDIGPGESETIRTVYRRCRLDETPVAFFNIDTGLDYVVDRMERWDGKKWVPLP